jgi:hypothetical protein
MMAFSYLVSPHVITQESVNNLSLKFVLKIFTRICRPIAILVTIRQTSDEGLYAFLRPSRA